MKRLRLPIEMIINGKRFRGIALEILANPKQDSDGYAICTYVPIKIAEAILRERDKIKIFLVVVKPENEPIKT